MIDDKQLNRVKVAMCQAAGYNIAPMWLDRVARAAIEAVPTAGQPEPVAADKIVSLANHWRARFPGTMPMREPEAFEMCADQLEQLVGPVVDA